MDKQMRFAIFTRSLLLQACWSFEGMQNLGFLMSLDPWLRRVYPEPAEYRAAVLRHLGYFNTHPYMAGIVLGVVGSMEERRSAMIGEERKNYEQRIEQMKKSLSAALAAIGDSFFWGALKPACAAWTILLWLFLWTQRVPHPLFWGAVFYLAAYNIPALWTRWRGIGLGYGQPDKIVPALEGLRWHSKALWIRRAGLAAAVLAFAGLLLVPPLGGAAGWPGVIVFAVALGLRATGIACTVTYAAVVVAGGLGVLVGF